MIILKNIALWSVNIILGLIGFTIIMYVVSLSIDTIGQYHEERDRCMKRATNGYEIERCK